MTVKQELVMEFDRSKALIICFSKTKVIRKFGPITRAVIKLIAFISLEKFYHNDRPKTEKQH